jgi:hypothetical protein
MVDIFYRFRPKHEPSCNTIFFYLKYKEIVTEFLPLRISVCVQALLPLGALLT